ncbi:uncharacterized protein [Spinacia oleracea]|uniref:Endonuclease/exonuclease/phosphatase domain-containing protein n=1 Tax=Spinacia oleracea TaxID=3562 RepID=A0ABM3RRN4_SPIOL|nr:uncharacterized protein LOC130471948 [Spinacia oleracea]
MNICTWNIRGLNEPLKANEVRRFLNNHSIHVVALLETRVRLGNKEKVQKRFGGVWTWFCNYPHSPKGRIWVGWRTADVDLQILSSSSQNVHCWIHTKDHRFSSFFTAVYGLHSVGHRQALWDELNHLSTSSSASPWLVAGDFNSILYSGDRINGNAVSNAETRDFNQCISDCDLNELHSTGWFFSWSSKGTDDPRVCSRIDRAFGNMKWMDSFSELSTKYLNPSLSDHSPIIIPCITNPSSGGRPFKFLNYLADHSSFESIMGECWNREDRGRPMAQIWFKLNRVKHKLKVLHKEEFSHTAEKIEYYRSELDNLQTQMRSDNSPHLLSTEKELICNLRKWLAIEEQALKQKSRVQWVKVGDSNHQFFYSAMKERFCINKVHLLHGDGGVEITDLTEIQSKIIDFYKQLLGSAASSLPGLDVPTIRNGNVLSSDSRALLCLPVTVG